MTLARIELRRSPCLPLPRFLEGAPAGLLRPSFRATLYLPKLANGLCRDRDVWVRLHSHLIWQATESYVEGGNAFRLVFHLSFLTRLRLDC
jgi:hypothetical protein